MDSKNDGRTYEQGREDQARYTMERLARRGLRISFISKVTGYDEATIKKWCYELNREEGIRLGKLEVSKSVSRNLHKMGKCIKEIAKLVDEDVETVTKWIAEKDEK